MKTALLISLLLVNILHAEDSCPKFTEMNYKNLIELIQNKNCNIKTINDVLKNLPEDFRTNPVLVYQSKSLQGPHETDYENPRALLYSKDGAKFVLSFNQKETDDGHDALEIMDASDEKKSKFFEIKFPNEVEAQTKSWNDIQKQILSTDETQGKCLRCHGDPARPIFSNYPDWPGVYGSQHIGSVSTEEEAGLQKFIEKTKRSDSRYSNLIFAPEKLDYSISQETKTYDTAAAASNNIDFGDALNNIQFKNFFSRLLEDKANEPYRYAMAGAVLQCANFTRFFPKNVYDQLSKSIEAKFALKKNWPPSRMKTYQKEINNYARKFRLIEGYKQWTKDDPEFERLFLDTVQKQEIQRGDATGPMLRFIFESRGIDISSIFTDLEGGKYRSSSLMTEDAVIKTIAKDVELKPSQETVFGKNPACTDLEKLSLKALSKIPVKELAVSCEQNKTSPVLSDKNQKQIEKLMTNLKPKAPAQMFEFYCSQCHGDKNQVAPPHLPLDNPKAMSGYIGPTTHLTPLIRLQEKSMPPSYAAKPLGDEDRKAMIEYLQTLKK